MQSDHRKSSDLAIREKGAEVLASLNRLSEISSRISISGVRGPRVPTAMALLRATADDARAIGVLCNLFGNELAGSAFSLLRTMNEKFKRGTWVALCATEADIAKFITHDKLPGADTLTKDIEKIPPFDTQKIFSDLHRNSSKKFHSYTHGGKRLIEFYGHEGAIGAAFPLAEVIRMLEHARGAAITSTQVLCIILGNFNPVLAAEVIAEMEAAFLRVVEESA